MTIASYIPFDSATAVQTRTVLHVGCGAADPGKLPAAFFPQGSWAEMRLDIDPGVAPDIVASITEMPMVADGSVDAVCRHIIWSIWPAMRFRWRWPSFIGCWRRAALCW